MKSEDILIPFFEELTGFKVQASGLLRSDYCVQTKYEEIRIAVYDDYFAINHNLHFYCNAKFYFSDINLVDKFEEFWKDIIEKIDKHASIPRCFKCNEEIKSSLDEDLVWEAPSGAVVLEGGHNFGSRVYDSMNDGISIKILICDDCLKTHRIRIKEIKND